MTRSFDRRGGYQGGYPAGGTVNVNRPMPTASASIRPKKSVTQDTYDRLFRAALNIEKEEPVSLDLDCMCSKNDPNCAECWVPDKPALSDFDVDVRYRFDECLELLLRKHKDYGPANIANAPGGPLNGLRVRMHDKLARINHLIDTGAAPSNESLRDSFLDLANYSVIALCVVDERWPTE